MITTLEVSPAVGQELSNAVGLTDMRNMARAYADGYNADSGDSVSEYVDRAAGDLYPYGIKGRSGDRAAFKSLIRHYMRERRAS